MPVVPISEHLADGVELPLASHRSRVIDMQGRDVPDPAGSARLEYRSGPRLRVHSGEILASDAFLICDEPVPFSRRLAPENYLVEAIVAHLPDGETRNAFAVLRVQESRAIRWEMATRVGEKVSDLRPGESFGYGVDFATGCFADLQTVLSIEPALWEGEGNHEEIERALRSSDGLAEVQVRDAVGWNVVAFDSGRGDGFYTSYWGFDGGNQPVCLVTDFGIIQSSTFDTAIEAISAKRGFGRWLKGWARR